MSVTRPTRRMARKNAQCGQKHLYRQSFPRTWVSFVIDMRKVLKVEVGIHLSAANARMTEQFLHRAQIAA